MSATWSRMPARCGRHSVIERQHEGVQIIQPLPSLSGGQHFSSNRVESACFLRLWVSSQNALETLFHEVPEFWMGKYKQFVLHDGVHGLLSNLVGWLT